jgi:hypothetical protein
MEDRNNRRRTRREFLRQAGKLALYTPPAVVLLTRPSLAQINGSPIRRARRHRVVIPGINSLRRFRRRSVVLL